MRISDWSSDGCSSDLGGAIEDGAVAGDEAHADDPGGDVAEVPAGAVGGRGDRAGDRLVGDVAHVLERHAPLVELRAQVLQRDPGLDRDGAGLAVVGEDLVVAAEVDHHAVGRSEEHTSELQSLMRISYAVFCLKK